MRGGELTGSFKLTSFLSLPGIQRASTKGADVRDAAFPSQIVLKSLMCYPDPAVFSRATTFGKVVT